MLCEPNGVLGKPSGVLHKHSGAQCELNGVLGKPSGVLRKPTGLLCEPGGVHALEQHLMTFLLLLSVQYSTLLMWPLALLPVASQVTLELNLQSNA